MEVSDSMIHHLFERQAKRHPDRVAVRLEDKALTYSELDRAANRIANSLVARGLGAEKLVGLNLGRSLELMVAVLGVLKSGAAYLPLDPQYPRDRLHYMAEDAAIDLSIYSENKPESRIESKSPAVSFSTLLHASAAETPRVEKNDSLAYVLYTSGSTGNPKGVEVTHASVINFLFSMQELFPLKETDVLLSVTGLSFDIAGLDLYLTWMSGGTLYLVPRAVITDGKKLKVAMEISGAKILQTTPVTWRTLLDGGWKAPPGFRALCGGEAMPESIRQELLGQNVELWNLYGPTETTVWSTAKKISAEGPITVGRAIKETHLYVLDEQRKPVTPGTPGELFIGGKGVARGYRNRPELTAERFPDDPFTASACAKMYRTGDRVRQLANGEIEWLGRMDHQIKYHGYRIEPGEIELALRDTRQITECVVALRERQGEPRLVAYVIPGPNFELARFRSVIQEQLPQYMIPSEIIELDAFPLTPNRKIDRALLT